MKKTCPFFLGLLLLAASAAQAQFTYTTYDGTITITGYTGPGGAVNIPSNIDNLPVTTIPSTVFASTTVTSITIPATVTSIYPSAFQNCYDLTAINVDPQNLYYSSVNGVLFNETQTTLVEYPDGAAAASYTIPGSVISIEDGAFTYCDSLTGITIPNSVITIGEGAFYSCRDLTGVTIPSSVTSIGSEAFGQCTSMTAITVDAQNPVYSSVNGALFDKSQTTLIEYPAGVSGSYTIPVGVTSIAGSAFYSGSLTSVTIPSSVTNIGELAFVGGLLTAVTVDAQNSFYSSVNGVLFNKSQTTLVEYPGDVNGSYTIPSFVTSIGEDAFYAQYGLTSVTIPASVTSIGSDAFWNSGLTSLTIPASVTSIGSEAFAYCYSLASVYFQGNAPSADSTVFEGDSDATICYVSGTTGWSSPFAGLPAGPCAAQSQTNCIPPPPGLIAWWPGNGNAQDIVGGNNGTLEGGVSYANGQSALAFDFDGTGTVVISNAPNLNFAPTAPITVEAWAYRATSGDPMHLVGKRVGCDGGTTGINYQLAFNEGAGQGLVFNFATGVDLPLNSWHHLVGTFDGSNSCFYLDGQLIGSAADTTLGPENNAPLLIGGSGSCAMFQGLMQNIRIYNRALSPQEVESNFDAGSSGLCTSLTGSLQVIITPVTAISNGAQWQVDGAQGINSGAITNLSAGSYTVSFTSISGWITPANQTVAITNGATTTATGIYTPASNYFADNFASYALGVFPSAGGWQLIYDGAGSGYQVVGLAPQQSGQALELVGSSCWDAAAFHPLSLPNNFTLEAELLITGDLSGGCTVNDAQFGIYNPSVGEWGTAYGLVYFENDGQIHASGDEGVGTALMPYQENTWYDIACDYNLTNETMGVRINGSATLAQVSITTGVAPTGIWLDAGHGGNPTLWIANLSLTVGAPAAMSNPPSITAPPASQTNVVGNSVTFTVAATGTAPLSYQWIFDNNPLSGATNSAYSIASIQASNGGSYTVVVSNAFGVTNATATLTIALPNAGQTLFMSEYFSGTIYEFTPGGVQSTFASGLDGPQALAIDSAGDLFVGNELGNSITKITPGGVQSTFASGLDFPLGLAFNGAGNLFVSSGGNVYEYTPNGVQGTFASGLNNPFGLAFNSAGDLFVASPGDLFESIPGEGEIIEITPDGVQSTFASGLNDPTALAFDSAGNLFASDSYSDIITKITPDGVQSTFASGLDAPAGLAFNSAGDMFEADYSGNIYVFSPGGVQTTFASGLDDPQGLAFSAAATNLAGWLQVIITPVTAISNGAQWQVDGGPIENSGAITNLSVGSYTVSFTSISGWSTPANQTVTITNGAITTATGVYTAATSGALTVTLLPSAAVSAGADWQLDGTNENSGVTVSNLLAGNYIISFTPILGWIAPANQTVTITNGATTAASGLYALAGTGPAGAVNVTLLPAGAVSAGAQWELLGGTSQNSGATVPYLSPGSHTVSFTTIPGWITPADQTVAVTNGAATTVNGVYTLGGALQVAITPASAIDSGAQWRLDEGSNQISGVTLTNLSAGLHTVSFATISGWDTPLDQTVTITNGATTTTGGIYTPSNAPSAVLILITNGSGVTQHAAWPGSLMIGKRYTVTAAPKAKNLFVGWVGGTNQPYSLLSSSARFTFTMQSNLVLQANFLTNVFLAAEGTYRGLFAPTNSARQQTNSGSFVLEVASSGAISGHLDLGGQTVPLSGKLDFGGATNIVSKRPRGEPSLTTVLQLDFADQSVSGTVSDGAFIAALYGNRDGFGGSLKATEFEGQYTLIIPGADDAAVGPYGTGYGTVKVSSAGTVTLAGSLADGTAISQSSAVSQSGCWPLYVSLYGGNGSLWGWNYFTSNQTLTAFSSLSWINAGNPGRTAVYRSGFTNQQAALTGGIYTPGQALPPGLAVTLQETNPPFTITVTNLSENTYRLTLRTNKTTGVISGSFANPDQPDQIIKVNGVILQGQTNAQGYFLGTDQSGSFLLESP